MSFKVVDLEDIPAPKTYPIVEQQGILRQFEKEMRCASRGCGSSTFYKLEGVPRCMTHALRRFNEILIEMGIVDALGKTTYSR